MASVNRYAKPGRANQEMSELPADVLAEVTRRAARLPRRLWETHWSVPSAGSGGAYGKRQR
eukprot:4435372-Lingulodinium_polyedra.AAC.1